MVPRSSRLCVFGMVGWVILGLAVGARSAESSLWDVVEPPPTEGLSRQQARAAMEPFWQQARDAEAAGDWDRAAQRFIDLASQVEHSDRQKAFMAAGNCRMTGNRIADAILDYETGVAIGAKLLSPSYEEAYKQTVRKRLSGPRLLTIRDNHHRLLKARARAYYRAHDVVNVAKSIRAMQAWFPEYGNYAQLLPLLAEAEGQSANRVIAAEQDANQICQQILEMKKAGRKEDAYAAIQALATRYPNSMQATRAIFVEGGMLWADGRYGDAREAYQEVVARLETIDANCPMARTSRAWVAYNDAGNLYHEIIAKRKGWPPSGDDWNALFATCRVGINNHSSLEARVTLHSLLISALFTAGRYGDAVTEETTFFEKYHEKNVSDPVLKRLFVKVSLTAVQSLSNLGRTDEALQRCDWVLAQMVVAPALPEIDRRALYEYTVFMKCMLLAEKGAPEGDLKAAVHAVMSTCSRELYVKRARVLLSSIEPIASQ